MPHCVDTYLSSQTLYTLPSMYQRFKFLAFRASTQLIIKTRKYTVSSDVIAGTMERTLLNDATSVLPTLSDGRHKGAAGRVGVIGGSLEYTGAPYFAAIAAMKVGCDLAHVFCQKAAASVIKSYSPELIVHPLLDDDKAVDLIIPWLERLHVLIIGPGLGRDESVFQTVTSIIQHCREQSKSLPLVIDADGLFLVTQHPEVVRDYRGDIVLTPNAMEFSRLAKSVLNETWAPTPNPAPSNVSRLAAALGSNIVVLHKGAVDIIATGEESFECTAEGSGRRCGGQGDLLCGSLGAFLAWASADEKKTLHSAGVVAAYAACRLTRECNLRAFRKTARSTLTSDMIREIHVSFESLFGV